MKKPYLLTAIAAATFLVACGGGGSNDNRGALLEAPQTLTTLTAAQINAGTAAGGLAPITAPRSATYVWWR